MRKRQLKVEANRQGAPLVRLLTEELRLSVPDARKLVEVGATYVDGRRCTAPERKLSAGQTVTVVLEERGRSALSPAASPVEAISIVFEDEWLLALNKPAGLPTQPTPSRVGDDLWSWAKGKWGAEVGLVHRLDLETSGLIVLGKNSEATSLLSGQFRRREAQKRYLAVAGPNLPEKGVVDLPLSKDPTHIGRFRAARSAHGLVAVTRYIRLFLTDDHSLVALYPQTGRTHQLRAHLATLGAPIVGDIKYGGAANISLGPAGRCLLHAQQLQLSHPRTNERLVLQAPLPDDMARIFAADGQQALLGDETE